MFSFGFTRSKTNFLPTVASNDFAWQARADSRSDIENRLARKGLLIGLSMERNTSVIYLVGKLNTANSPIFKELIKTFISNHYNSFVFDLSGLTGLDSAGVATLVWARNKALEAGGFARVTNPSVELYNRLIAINFQYLVEIENFNFAVATN